MLEERMVATGVEAATWQQAASAAGQLLVDDGAVDPAYVGAMIASVEKFGPYMIPVPDVAFFHAAPGEHVTRSALSFVTLHEPVFFSEFANQRVRAAFAFGAVDQDSHFGMLAHISERSDIDILTNLCRRGNKSQSMRVTECFTFSV